MQLIRLMLSLVAISWLLWSATSLYGQGNDVAPYNDSILGADLKADLFFFASDAMKGRQTGTPENFLAAEYIKSKFERLGLKPVGTAGSYFQDYNLIRATLGEENLLEVTRN